MVWLIVSLLKIEICFIRRLMLIAGDAIIVTGFVPSLTVFTDPSRNVVTVLNAPLAPVVMTLVPSEKAVVMSQSVVVLGSPRTTAIDLLMVSKIISYRLQE